MRFTRRARLFIRDYVNEFGVAWSVARYRDCERSGGHRWGPPSDDAVLGFARTCGRCGTGEPVATTSGTGCAMSPLFKGGVRTSTNATHATLWVKR